MPSLADNLVAPSNSLQWRMYIIGMCGIVILILFGSVSDSVRKEFCSVWFEKLCSVRIL